MRPPKNNPPPLYTASPRKSAVRTPRKAIQARAKRVRQRRHSQSSEVIDIDINLDSDDDCDHDDSAKDCDRGDSVQDPPASASQPASQPAPKKPRSAPKKSQSASNNTPAYDVFHFFGPRLNPQEAKGNLRPCLACNKDKKKNDTWYSYTTGNSNLRNHLETDHKEEYLRVCEENGWEMQLPKLRLERLNAAAADSFARDGDRSEPSRSTFTKDLFLQHLINFITADDQSINVIECPEFRKLLLLLRQDLQDKDIPHRTKLREAIIIAWKRWFKVLKADLANSVGKISFSADVWSDRRRRAYLCITLHWLARALHNNSLELKAGLLGFHRIRGTHSGANLAKIAVKLLDRAGITAKTGHWTLDNAANNNTFMVELQTLLNDRDIPFDHKENRIRCFPHIINICVEHVLKEFTKVELVDVDFETQFAAAVGSPSSDTQTLAEALERDPIARGRMVVNAIRASGQRRDAFEELIIDGNARGYFKVSGKTIKLNVVQLLHDVRTRWDSVYNMIKRLREMRPAIDRMLALDPDLTKLKITELEWKLLQDFQIVLEIPHKAQMVMAGEHNPILAGAVPAFELFMTRWEQLADKNPHLKSWIAEGLVWAKEYYCKMDDTKAYVIAMLLNPCIRMSWINKQWDEEWAEQAAQIVKDTMKEYRTPSSVESEDLAIDDSEPVPLGYETLGQQYGLEDMDIFAPSDQQDQTIEQEYQSYVTARPSSAGTSTIKFWEDREKMFPTLFAIAADYLPIQASAVPSERAFSSSGETDTKKRNRINPVLMEALQMLKFALKKERLNFGALLMTTESEMSVSRDSDEDLLGNLFRESASEDDVDQVLKMFHRDDED